MLIVNPQEKSITLIFGSVYCVGKEPMNIFKTIRLSQFFQVSLGCYYTPFYMKLSHMIYSESILTGILNCELNYLRNIVTQSPVEGVIYYTNSS